MINLPNTTITTVVNDDGSVTITRTTVSTQTLTAEQYQAQQDALQKQIDILTAQQTTNEATLTQVQSKVASLKATPVNKI